MQGLYHSHKNCKCSLVFGVGFLGCILFLAGCSNTLLPEKIAERGLRIQEINAKLHDNMQVLLAYARQENVDLDLANKALDGVFMIIGHPDSKEMLMAKCLGEDEVNAIITNSVDLKKERAQLSKDNDKDQKLLSKKFYDYKDSHAIVGFLKLSLGFLAGFGLLAALFFFKPKLF